VWDVSLLGRGEALTVPTAKAAHGAAGVEFSTASRVVTVSGLGTVLVWDSKAQERIAEFPGLACPTWVADFDVSPDGSSLASGCFRGSYIVDLETGKQLATLAVGGWTLGVAFSPDGSMVATTGSDGSVRIFDARSGEVLKSLSSRMAGFYGRTEGPRLHAVEWSPDGSRLLAVGRRVTSVWDIDSGRLLHELPAGAVHTGFRAAWSPDGAYLLLGGSTGVGIWAAESGEKVGEVPSGEVRSVALSPDGARLAIAASDGTARVWNWRTSEELLVFRHKVEAFWAHQLAFSPDGGQHAVQRATGVVHVFALDIEQLLEVARSRVTRGLTGSECEQYLQRACSTP
jgi:WD40 repeat protein